MEEILKTGFSGLSGCGTKYLEMSGDVYKLRGVQEMTEKKSVFEKLVGGLGGGLGLAENREAGRCRPGGMVCSERCLGV